jgi:hypothetical protein
MAMLRALPREEYADFVSSLMQQKDLTRANVEAAFQVKQTERDTHRRPLLSPSGDTALRTAAQPPRATTTLRRTKDHAREDMQKAIKERRGNRDGAKKDHANRDPTPPPRGS